MQTQIQLQRFEGRKNAAYPDPDTRSAPFTIGIGHTGPEVHPGLVWDDYQIDAAFQLDFNKAWQACVDRCTPWFQTLCEPRQAVLINMAFQAGSGVLDEFAPTLGLIRDERFADAAEHIRQSKLYTQAPNRWRVLAYQMETGDWQA